MPQGNRNWTSHARAPISRSRKLPVAVIVLISLLVSLVPSAASAAEEPAAPKQPKLSDARQLKDKSDLPPLLEPGVLPDAVTPPTGPGVELPADPAGVIGVPPATTPEGWEPEQEIVRRRTATTRTFTGRSPGEFETRVYPEPVNFKQGSRWLAIDSTLDVSKAGKRKSKSNSFELELADSSDNPELAKLVIDDKHSVGFGMQQAAKVRGRLDRNTLTYSRVQKDTDVKLTSTRSGLKEELILSSPQAPDRFVFPLILKGLTASIDEHGDVVYSDSDGKEQARTPHGFMFDSNIDPRSDEPARSTGVDYALIPHGNGIALEVTLDREWLDSPGRVYPITVDPEINRGTWADDTYVMSPFNADYSSDTELKVGTFNGGTNKARSFMHFDTGNLPGTVTGAQLQMRELHSYNCTNPPENVHRVTQQWQGSTMRTFPGASYDSWATSGSWVAGSGTCGNRLAVWNVTGDVQHLKNTGQTQGSFAAVAGNESDSYRWKKYRSFQAGDGPVLKIWTGYGPHIPTELSPGSHQHQIGPAMQLSARYVDADGGAGMLAFGLWNTAGTMVFNQWSPWICSGCTATMNTPALPGNAWYDLRVAAYDGATYSDFTPAGHWVFNDVRPPYVPTQLTPAAGSTVGTSFTASARYSEYYGWPGQIMFWVNDPAGNYVTSVYSSTVNHQTVASATINLQVGQYDLYAYGFDGQYSALAGPHRISVAGAPGAPTGLNADTGPSSARVRWSPGPSNGSPITRYDLTAYNATNQEAPPASKTCSSPCSPVDGFAFDGLVPGHSYTFRATASNAFGTSPLSSASQPVTVRSTDDYAGNVVATPGDRQVRLDWEAQFLATSYRLNTYRGTRPANGVVDPAHFVTSIEVDAADTTETITDLNNGSSYYFTVTPVVLLLLVGPPSAASNEAVPFGMPFAPAEVTKTGGDNEVLVAWSPPQAQPDGTSGDNGAPITSYKVYLHEAIEAPPTRTIDVASENNFAIFGGLENGSIYHFRVTASNAAGEGSLSGWAAGEDGPKGRPFPPENPSAVPGARIAAITWDPPAQRADGTPGDNGSPITGYRVLVSPACGGCEGTRVGTVTSTTVTGLAAGATYTFQVVSRNSSGESQPSVATEPASFPAEVPSAPTDVVAQRDGPPQETVQVMWQAAEPNGSPITSYTVVAQPGGTETQTTATSISISGLDSASPYSFRVRATNAVGDGPLSDPSEATSAPLPHPLAPTNVEGTAAGSNSAKVTWDRATPDSARDYRVKALLRQLNGQYELARQVNSGYATSSLTFDNLAVGVYRFVVASVNATGEAESVPSEDSPVWDEEQARGWMFEDSLNEFLGVRAQNPMPYSFDSDGCSVPPVLDLSPYDERFEDDCKRHDYGYQNFGRRLRISQLQDTKDQINAQFLEDMHATCTANPQWNHTSCRNAARAFQIAVDVSDDGFWDNEEWSWSEDVDNPE